MGCARDIFILTRRKLPATQPAQLSDESGKVGRSLVLQL